MARRLPPLNALVAFDAVARHGSIKLAASTLYVTASAVGQQIKNLENWMGVPLFRRTRPGLELTPRGRAYHGIVSSCLDQLSDATSSTEEATKTKMVIGAPATFAQTWLIPRLRALRSMMPGCALSVKLCDSVGSYPFEEMTHNLIDLTLASADIVISMGRRPPESSATLLTRDEVLVVASPAVIQETGPLCAEALAEQELLDGTMPESWGLWFDAAGLPAETHRPPSYRFSHSSLLLEAAASGLGYALTHRTLAEPYLLSERLVRAHELTLPSSYSYYVRPVRGAQGRAEVLDCIEHLKALATPFPTGG